MTWPQPARLHWGVLAERPRARLHPPAGKVQGKAQAALREAAMESMKSAWLCSVIVLLGAALLLPAPGSTRALSDTGEKGLATEQDVVTVITQGTRAMDVLEKGKASIEVEPGIKVTSGAWAQAEPEEDRDHLYHPQDDAREVYVHEPLRMLPLEVQSSLEEDRDHLHHS